MAGRTPQDVYGAMQEPISGAGLRIGGCGKFVRKEDKSKVTKQPAKTSSEGKKPESPNKGESPKTGTGSNDTIDSAATAGGAQGGSPNGAALPGKAPPQPPTKPGNKTTSKLVFEPRSRGAFSHRIDFPEKPSDKKKPKSATKPSAEKSKSEKLAPISEKSSLEQASQAAVPKSWFTETFGVQSPAAVASSWFNERFGPSEGEMTTESGKGKQMKPPPPPELTPEEKARQAQLRVEKLERAKKRAGVIETGPCQFWPKYLEFDANEIRGGNARFGFKKAYDDPDTGVSFDFGLKFSNSAPRPLAPSTSQDGKDAKRARGARPTTPVGRRSTSRGPRKEEPNSGNTLIVPTAGAADSTSTPNATPLATPVVTSVEPSPRPSNELPSQTNPTSDSTSVVSAPSAVSAASAVSATSVGSATSAASVGTTASAATTAHVSIAALRHCAEGSRVPSPEGTRKDDSPKKTDGSAVAGDTGPEREASPSHGAQRPEGVKGARKPSTSSSRKPTGSRSIHPDYVDQSCRAVGGIKRSWDGSILNYSLENEASMSLDLDATNPGLGRCSVNFNTDLYEKVDWRKESPNGNADSKAREQRSKEEYPIVGYGSSVTIVRKPAKDGPRSKRELDLDFYFDRATRNHFSHFSIGSGSAFSFGTVIPVTSGFIAGLLSTDSIALLPHCWMSFGAGTKSLVVFEKCVISKFKSRKMALPKNSHAGPESGNSAISVLSCATTANNQSFATSAPGSSATAGTVPGSSPSTPLISANSAASGTGANAPASGSNKPPTITKPASLINPDRDWAQIGVYWVFPHYKAEKPPAKPGPKESEKTKTTENGVKAVAVTNTGEKETTTETNAADALPSLFKVANPSKTPPGIISNVSNGLQSMYRNLFFGSTMRASFDLLTGDLRVGWKPDVRHLMGLQDIRIDVGINTNCYGAIKDTKKAAPGASPGAKSPATSTAGSSANAPARDESRPISAYLPRLGLKITRVG